LLVRQSSFWRGQSPFWRGCAGLGYTQRWQIDVAVVFGVWTASATACC
jgi:hypothetical protein